MRRQVLRVTYGVMVAGGVWLGAQPARAAEPQVDAAAVFTKMGCHLCHAPGARYHERLRGTADKSAEDVARWIRNPEKFIPGTAMPTYASLIDEPTALALAKWLKAGGPDAAGGKK
jgi:mono/diheme cytochrome c family protein